MMPENVGVEFIVNTEGLLREIIGNPSVGVLEKPIGIFGNLLFSVAERAAELNDPELNALMCRLALYSVSDPSKPEYDEELVARVYEAEAEAKKTKG